MFTRVLLICFVSAAITVASFSLAIWLLACHEKTLHLLGGGVTMVVAFVHAHLFCRWIALARKFYHLR